jgi:hypothetical protein
MSHSTEQSSTESTRTTTSRRRVLALAGGGLAGAVAGCLTTPTDRSSPTAGGSPTTSPPTRSIDRSPTSSPTPSDGRYRIERADETVPITGAVEDTPWARATAAALDTFRWIEEPLDEPATVRVLYDDTAVYCQYQVPDTNISADVTELNGPVYTDSAVEWFFDPTPDDPKYCNFEANCLGTFILSWRSDRSDKEFVTPETASTIRIQTSVSGSKRTPTSADESWWLAAAVPFSALESLTGRSIAPTTGTTWHGNFHRLNSEDGTAVGVWNPIETESRSLHSPEFFGDLVFA